jgi:hypothetical protein
MLHAKISYLKSAHLSQIYEGFNMLHKKGIISADFVPVGGNIHKPIIEVIINQKYQVMYDALDGLNWTNGDLEENLNFFKSTYQADFYYKRSYLPILSELSESMKVLPLGLNFALKGNYPLTPEEQIKEGIKKVKSLLGLPTVEYPPLANFEYLPFTTKVNKILFMVKLWSPDETSIGKYKDERNRLNQARIKLLRACKTEFKDSFIGGIIGDEYSKRVAPDLVLPNSFTQKESFLRLVKEASICIATEGLHGSTGWKFAEFVASAKAILTEPLRFELPGDFREGKNYLTYTNENELIQSIYKLLNNGQLLNQMMLENYQYYHAHVRPDMLILNTLKPFL